MKNGVHSGHGQQFACRGPAATEAIGYAKSVSDWYRGLVVITSLYFENTSKKFLVSNILINLKKTRWQIPPEKNRVESWLHNYFPYVNFREDEMLWFWARILRFQFQNIAEFTSIHEGWVNEYIPKKGEEKQEKKLLPSLRS